MTYGADIDARDKWDLTPLFIAIYEEPLVFDHSLMVDFLVSMGADITLKDDRGDTPLHMACSFTELKIAEILLGKGADINALNNAGDTPLHQVVKYYESVMVKFMLSQKNININIKNFAGFTPIDIAKAKGWDQIVKLLKKFKHSS